MITELEYYGNKEYTEAFENMDITLRERLNSVLTKISIPELQQFVTTIISRTYLDNYKIEDAVGVAEMTLSYFAARHLYNPMAPSKQVDVAVTAALLHNAFFDREYCTASEDWIEVYTLRERFASFAEELVKASNGRTDIGAFEYAFQIIEAQLGESMPILGSRPVRGQITQDVWEVMWFYYAYQRENEEVA